MFVFADKIMLAHIELTIALLQKGPGIAKTKNSDEQTLLGIEIYEL